MGPPRKLKRQDDDTLSVHASNSDDDLNDLINRRCPPGPSKDTDIVDSEDALLKELEAALHEDDKKGPKI